MVTVLALLSNNINSFLISPYFLFVEFHHYLQHSFSYIITIVFENFKEKGHDLAIGSDILLDLDQTSDIISDMS